MKRHSPDDNQPEISSDLILTSVMPAKKKKHNNLEACEEVNWKDEMISKFDNLIPKQTTLMSTQTTLVDKLSLLNDKIDSILSLVRNLQNGNS